MAVLDATQLAQLRKLSRVNWTTAIDFDKPIANSTLQSVEDWYEGERATVSSDIDAASSPKVFSNPEKKLIAAAYLSWKNGEGG